VFRPRDLPLLAVFAVVARHGAVTAAARELGLSKSVVSEHLRSLEERCGARLFERSPRGLRLTQLGEQLRALATSLGDTARDVDALLDEHRSGPVGTLRVSTTHDLGPRFVTPLVGRLAARHPDLRVEVVTDDAVTDLIGNRFDVAIRLSGGQRDSSLVMRRLCSFEEPIVAAPSLAARYRDVRRPSELAGAPWVRHALVHKQERWSFHGPGPRREVEEVAVAIRGQANTGDGVRALLVAGAGCGVLPDYQLADELRRGALVRLCDGWSWKTVTLFALLPSRKRPRRVELFLTALEDAVRAEGWS